MHIARINEFFVEGKNQRRSHVLLHITEPTTKEEWKRGYFFALCEIEQGNLELIGHAHRLIDDIESGYYETEASADGKSPFELTLEFINRRSNHLLSSDGTLHCIVGVLNDTSLSLSYHGDPHAQVFFLQKDTIKSIDILAGGEPEQEEHLFSAVIEGNINPGDRLFIGTPHMTNELSIERLQEIIMSRPIAEAVAHIERVLQDARSDESYGGIVCDIAKKDIAADPSTSNSAASLQHLLDRERETTETLSPSLFGGKKKKTGNTTKTKRQQKRRNAIETNHRRRSDEIIGGSFANMVLVAIGRGLVRGANALWRAVRFVSVTLARFFVMLFILVTNKNNGRSHTIRSLKESWRNLQRSVMALPLVSKVLLLGVVSLSLIFVGSFSFLRVQEHYTQKERAYQASIQAIEDKRAAAEARKIYNDDAGAFALLKEAETMVAALPQENKAQTETFETLSSDIESALLDLRDITTVDAEVIADLTGSAENVQANKLVRIDDALVAFGAEDNRLYVVDKDTGGVSIETYDSLAKLTAANTPKENDIIAFTGADNAVYVYNKETKALSNTTIAYPSANPRITAPFIYNLRLYLIDAANNQILRHSKTQGGYDKGTPWLDESVSPELGDAVATAIDGDIFVLKANGQVLKFTGGEQVSFDVSGLDPVLEAPTELYTYSDVDGIYILEGAAKRVVELNKQGTFRAQYTNPAWQNPSGMVVDEAKRTIYVLDANKIYRFTF